MTRRFHSAIKINIFCEILIFTARCRVQPVAASDDRTGWREMRGGRGTRAEPADYARVLLCCQKIIIKIFPPQLNVNFVHQSVQKLNGEQFIVCAKLEKRETN